MIMRVKATRMPYLGENSAKVGRKLIFRPKTCNLYWLDGKEPETFNIYSYFDPFDIRKDFYSKWVNSLSPDMCLYIFQCLKDDRDYILLSIWPDVSSRHGSAVLMRKSIMGEGE